VGAGLSRRGLYPRHRRDGKHISLGREGSVVAERFDRLLGLGRSAARWRVVERPIKQVWDTGPPQKRVDVARLARLHVTSNMQNAPSPAAVTKPTL
jgi:hypothetical protein